VTRAACCWDALARKGRPAFGLSSGRKTAQCSPPGAATRAPRIKPRPRHRAEEVVGEPDNLGLLAGSGGFGRVSCLGFGVSAS